MSTHIHFFAEREILVVKTGQRTIQREKIDAIQTPTPVTHQIRSAADPVAAYVEWVMDRAEGNDHVEDIYADDDIFGEREPIGTRVVNDWRSSAEKFVEEVKARREAGWDIRVEAW